MSGYRLSVGQCATLSCLWEVTIPKPGNVHRGADFDDMAFSDFVASAVAIGPAMESAGRGTRVGQVVLDAVRMTRQCVATNTNLGTILLLAPMAAIPRDRPLAEGIRIVLRGLEPEDARLVYQAINEAHPGGLGHVPSMDLADTPPDDLLVAMRSAAERDLVARQYAEDFQHVFELVVPWLVDGLKEGWTLTTSVVHAHVRMMKRFPDSLIARKAGLQVAEEASARAAAVLDAGTPASPAYQAALGDLDFWLRSDGHRRNPGTTADMIAAGLFVLLRDEITGPSAIKFA